MGSVGKNYLRVLSDKNRYVDYIDLEDKYIDNPSVQYKTWDNISSSYTGIIHCNYAFQRHENFMHLENIFSDYHIVEKLCFSSLADIEMYSCQRNHPKSLVGTSKMYTHLRWNILKIDEFLKNKEREFGKICGINLLGGNLCFSMGGAHWIGLALSLLPSLNARDSKIFSNIEINNDSPRSEHIEMLSGQFSLTNKANYLYVAFDRFSHLAPKFVVNYKYGRIELGLDDIINLSKIEKQEYKPFQYELPRLFSVKHDMLNQCPFETLIEECDDGKGIPMTLGLEVSSILIKLRIMSTLRAGSVLDLGSELFDKCKDERFIIT